jgi:hypothetical protein
MKNEQADINKEDDLILIRQLKVSFEFFVDSVHLKISSPETTSNLEEEAFYNLNDID